MEQRLDHIVVPHNEGTDSFGSADLVSGDTQERHGEVREGTRDLSDGLDRICVERDPSCFGTPRDLGDILKSPDLVVHPHDTQDGDAALERPIHGVEIDPTVAIHWEEDRFAAQMLDGLRRLEHGLVLDGAHGHAEWPAAGTGCQSASDHGEIIGFRAPRRENHLAGLHPKGRGHLAPRQVDRGPRGTAEPVR